MLFFVILYIVATLFYPGGSQHDKTATGFSWLHNYCCNLLNTTAMNGEQNNAKPIAIAALSVLCVSLATFWYQFPRYMGFQKSYRIAVRISGITAMATALFLLTPYHDAVINIAGIAGVIALAGTLVGLYKNSWRGLFLFGLFNLLLVGVNNYLYYATNLFYLPVVQKITFACFLLWFCLIDIKLLLKTKL